uniref:Immunoglobulin domain-containing protein n=1 Tax=Myripristis murdjan TaxID=586833 RepID=A0A667YRS7_9TELE
VVITVMKLIFLCHFETSFYVRDGAEVSLPCGSLIPSQDKCQYTTWNVHHVKKISAEELVAHGKISPNEFAQANAARLSVTADCSLVIKKVTAEDAGRYFCQQFKSGQRQGSDAVVYLRLTSPLCPQVRKTENVMSCLKYLNDDLRNNRNFLLLAQSNHGELDG